MFKEQESFESQKNKIESKKSINKKEFLQANVSEAVKLINEDFPGSQEIAGLSGSEKAKFFRKKCDLGQEELSKEENFNYLNSLNYEDRSLASGVMFIMGDLPKEWLEKYRQKFPEDKIIENIWLQMMIDVEHYSNEKSAYIDNKDFDQVRAKTSEISLFLDKNLRLLKNDPELFNYFVENYKEFASSIKEASKTLNKVISYHLYDQYLSFADAFSAIISRIELGLLELEQALKSSNNHKEIVDTFVRELKSDSKNRLNNIKELGKIAEQFNKTYNQLGRDVLKEISPGEKNIYDYFDESDLPSFLDDYSDHEKDLILSEFQESKKFSVERLKELISFYQQSLEWEDMGMEILGDKYSEESLQQSAKEKALYEETLAKLQQLLPLQVALEKKLDQLIYGREEVKLPKGFNDFEKSEVRPEEIPEQIPLYFPVGISKDLLSWEQVLADEKKFAKPIDLYGYMFWLNNQGRKVDLVICDEIQVNNYQIRYDQSESEARQKAQMVGDQEFRQYEKIIDTFGLDNINIQRYQEFIGQNKDEYERYRDVVKNLSNHEVFKEAFLSMVQESVSGAEKEEYIAYALEELAWILSVNGTKIGHLNEARYDILGAVIHNFEKIGKEQGLDVLANPDSPEAKIILNTVCKLIRDAINERKSKLDKNSPALAYFQRLQEYLAKIKNQPRLGHDKSIKKDALTLNFVCPDVGSASFGFRSGFEDKEGVVKFKEPYSTYFYKNDSDLLINSDQVVAASDGFIGGKILTLDNKKQLKYAESVVHPILKHYFASIKKAPENYFTELGKNREDLLAEVKEANSLLEVLRFVQKYIVKPTQIF